MEKLRRALKIYWAEHGTPILFWTLVILGVIIVVQALNALAIQKEANKQKNNNTISNNSEATAISTEENKENEELIKKFISNCKENKIEEAYNLLSENCKKDLYSTVNTFSNQYYKKFFASNRDIEIQYDSNNIYKIIFYEDILESGKIEGRENVIDYYKIEQEVIEKKIYINLNQEKQ